MSEALPGEHRSAVVRQLVAEGAQDVHGLVRAVPGTLTGVVLWPLTLAR